TRASITSAANTGYPAHGSAEGRAAFREALADLLAVLPPDEGDRLIASCVAIYSAPFWQMLRDRGRRSASEAREAGVATMDALRTAARARAAPLTPRSPGGRHDHRVPATRRTTHSPPRPRAGR